ncbi:hypothetical protein [Streptomyces luteogriseus]|uniref:Riboflavin biosynthesis pyrimidine reductase n=1 Tax=Streptomyces luteogriseus TaxID=68233 RepID=A0A7W7GJQ0_9ACTN|nr:hypothetical protein [Streptomyces luteogriseus]MBB4715459.1 riboflavin biosynthesis pyrimidine reductase [Streptomyces luteogriseus]
MRYARLAKGAVTVTAATAVCHTLMTAGYAWAGAKAATGEATIFAGAFEWLVTTAGSWALMPLLLGAGMRAMRERGNTTLMVGGGLLWALLSLSLVDEIDRPDGSMPLPFLVFYVLAGTGLAGAGDRTARSG